MKNGQKSAEPLGKFSHRNKKTLTANLSLLIPRIMPTFKNFRYIVWEEIDFEILRSDLMLRLCDDWCSHQNLSLTFDITR
jgi:hypothetical protein